MGLGSTTLVTTQRCLPIFRSRTNPSDLNAQLVEVLPQDEYEAGHLPGAISIPLKELTRETADTLLDPSRPIVVYCWDDG